MIPIEHKQEIIQSGINFMRSITDAYGTDEGMKLWDSIASVLDPDVKGQIFFALLTGEYNGIVILTGHKAYADKISMIKAVRTVDTRRLTLKEAKDLCEDLMNGKPQKLYIDPKNRSFILSELRNAEFLIGTR